MSNQSKSEKSKTGTLYLIPVPLGEMNDAYTLSALPAIISKTVNELSHFAVENEKTARAFLKSMNYPKAISEAKLTPIGEGSTPSELMPIIGLLKNGTSVGILSEAGCPGIADPGARLVSLAHENHISVKPLTGPSSIILALMASGLNGQKFTFHGYLPIPENERTAEIRKLEIQSLRENMTQIFIETPYRNEALFETLLKSCKSSTQLCIAADLTTELEFLCTHTIQSWNDLKKKGALPSLHKRPAIYLIQS